MDEASSKVPQAPETSWTSKRWPASVRLIFRAALWSPHDRRVFYLETLNKLRRRASPASSPAPDLGDFSQVLAHWGVTEEQLPMIKRGLVTEICSMILLLALGIALTLFGQAFGGFCIFCVGVAGVITRTWRLWTLHYRQFIPVKDWLLLRW